MVMEAVRYEENPRQSPISVKYVCLKVADSWMESLEEIELMGKHIVNCYPQCSGRCCVSCPGYQYRLPEDWREQLTQKEQREAENKEARA